VSATTHEAVPTPRHGDSRRTIPLAVAALAFVTLTAAEQPAPRLTQAEAEAVVAEVVPQLQAIRGFGLKKKVPVTVIDDRRARAYALGRFRRLTPEGKIRADQTTFRLLGLLPQNVDIEKELLDVLEEQAGGYYDPETKSFYLLDDMPKEMTALLAAHEMTHALDDQRYDLDGLIAKVSDDDDVAFALSAVIEGNATLVAAKYVAKVAASQKPDTEHLGDPGEAVRMERLDAMPALLRRQLLGPYALGPAFLARGDVDAAWARPPRSSEQILHPEKYWDPARRDDPKRVTIPNPSRRLGKGWKQAGSGVLGELTIGGLVGVTPPQAADLAAGGVPWTNAAASGWGGDRFELWTKGDDSIVLLATLWDTEKDAEEFAAALPRKTDALAFRREGARVGIVAGAFGDRGDALLALLVQP
jgi:hypothetical protein